MSTTPGPWKICSANGKPYRTSLGKLVVESPETDVCFLDADTDFAEANACLIAAAPDLLEALRALMWPVNGSFDDIESFVQDSAMNSSQKSEWRCRLSQARAAIAKAVGQ